jgi:hypothetical protein
MNPEETFQFRELCFQIIGERDEARYPDLLRRLEAIGDKKQPLHDQGISGTPQRYVDAS